MAIHHGGGGQQGSASQQEKHGAKRGKDDDAIALNALGIGCVSLRAQQSIDSLPERCWIRCVYGGGSPLVFDMVDLEFGTQGSGPP